MHLLTKKIKDAWHTGKMALVLFLDIQVAFPNIVRERLLHNMHSWQVLTSYICLIDKMLTGHSMLLKFDDFISDLIDIHNGTTQGCPLSMLIYAFYNADLVNIAKGKNETSLGFVDDGAFLAVSSSLDKNRRILKDMMERQFGRFEWSISHNSPFKLSKLALMDFPHTTRDFPTNPLTLKHKNLNNTITTQIINWVQTYKYLGIHFDPKLWWYMHIPKVITSATWWLQQLWRISKTVGGLSPGKVWQLYNTVAVPTFTYVADIWYIPPFKQADHTKLSSLVAPTKAFTSLQRQVTHYITGGINGTAEDILEVHTNVLPVDLLFCKVQFCTASCLCTIPPSHSL